MRYKNVAVLGRLVFDLWLLLTITGCSNLKNPTNTLFLNSGWQVKSANSVSQSPEVISTRHCDTTTWMSTTIPATVLATQLENGVISNPFYRDNFGKIPGYSSDGWETLPTDGPYGVPWYYRNEFISPPKGENHQYTLIFEGINYKADVWLNGKKIGDKAVVQGTFRRFTFDVTPYLKPDQVNVLALTIWAPQKEDLAISWVDWNPTPQDRNMGIWQDVKLKITGPVSLTYPAVLTELAGETARLRVIAKLENNSNQFKTALLKVTIAGKTVEQTFILADQDITTVRLNPADYPELIVAQPTLWWPAQMGSPHLYTAEFQIIVDGQISDQQSIHFGIREVTSRLNEHGAREFSINGVPLLIRGGGWTSDIFLREDTQNWDDQLDYVQDMGLNTLRLEGKLENARFIEKCDQRGILLMMGWCCCDSWESSSSWGQGQLDVAYSSLEHQANRLKRHPSVIAWMNGSDKSPIRKVESEYLRIIETTDFDVPVLSSATETASMVSGPTGVKMEGPYDWIPPNYWLLDKKFGGAHGFNTETGPGPAIPRLSSLTEFLKPEDLHPISEEMEFHAGQRAFANLDIFSKAMVARHGAPKSSAELVQKSDLMSYEAQRAMFEGFSRNKYQTTGVIQWMLNDAWPSLRWHLYDYYLQPTGGYFGSKKAMTPIHAMYAYDDHSVWLINSTYQAHQSLMVQVRIFDTHSKLHFEKRIPVAELGPDENNSIFNLSAAMEELQLPTEVFFVSLRVQNAHGDLVDNNFYWLAKQMDQLDFEKNTWFYCPVTSYADFAPLNTMPKVLPKLSVSTAAQENVLTVTVILENSSDKISFFNRLSLIDTRTSTVIAPVLWSDNYVSLLPGETHIVTGITKPQRINTNIITVSLDGWNSF